MRATQIEHFAAGTVILRQAGEPARHLSVVRKGEVELLDGGLLLDLLGEGEVFGQFSLMARESPTLTVRAAEDTLCYLIDASVADDVLESSAGVAFMVSSMRRRLRRAVDAAQPETPDPQLRPIGELVRRPAVTIRPGASVAEAASLMAAERVSCLPIAAPGEHRPLGILTDRDLRTKVVAERRSPDTPVEEVATFPVVTLAASAPAGEALLSMFERGVHHFPVVDAAGALVGVVTDTDLMGLGRDTPFAIRSAIERAGSPEEVAAAGRDLPAVVASLVDASADPVDVGRVIALVVDALTRRLLALGRNGWATRRARGRGWRSAAPRGRSRRCSPTRITRSPTTARRASTGGSPTSRRSSPTAWSRPASRGAGATRWPCTPTMRRPLADWVGAMRGWMDDPGPKGSILSSIVFDYRHVAGALDAQAALDAVVREARSHPGFLRHLGRRALGEAPPTGFFRDLVVEAGGEHAGRLDVKHGGITIITSLARAFATGAGLTERRTIERLLAAPAAGTVDRGTAQELAEAFRFLWEIRLTHQVAQVRAGEPPDDFVDPHGLGPVARTGLKEAFRVITRAQRSLALDLGVRPP